MAHFHKLHGGNPTTQTDEYGNPIAPRVDQYGNPLGQHDTTTTGYAVTTGEGAYGHDYEREDYGTTGGLRQQYGSNPAAQTDEYGNPLAPRVDQYGNPLGQHDTTATGYAATTEAGQGAYGHDYRDRKDHGATGVLRQQYGSNQAAQTDEYGNPVAPQVDQYGNPLGQYDTTSTGYTATTGAGQVAYGHDYERKDHGAAGGRRQQYGTAQTDEYGNPLAPRVDQYGNPLGQHDYRYEKKGIMEKIKEKLGGHRY